MEKQPSIDRSLLIPAAIGVLSLLGIILVLFVGRLNASRPPVVGTDTPTAFKYLFLGTEPGISTEPSPEESLVPSSSDEPPAPTGSPGTANTPGGPKTPTKPNASNTLVASPIVLPNVRTPTSAGPPPLGSGTYDDIDYRLIYSGEWIGQTDVSGAFQGTLHISNTLPTPGNSVVFRFIGLEAHLFFQPGSGLGTVQISLDGKQYKLLDQSNSLNEEPITAATAGTHTVLITHVSGGTNGSVNLDYVIVLIVSTPTPTATAQ